MKICIMGTGGLGSFFGGWLAASGADVAFIARGPHLEAIRANGLTVKSQLGERHVADAQATDKPEDVGPVDIVLFCVKNYDLEQAALACRPLLKPETAVISILNGVDAAERIEEILGPGHAVPGTTLVPATVASPGVVNHVGVMSDLTFGEASGTTESRLTRFRDICRAAELDAQIPPDIALAIWTKFVGWSATSALTSASRSPARALQSIPALNRLVRDVATETFNVGRAKGVNLPDGLVDRVMEILGTYPAQTKTSMLVDLERGKRIELEASSGTVVRLGQALGVDTPVSRVLYSVLLPFIDGGTATAHPA
jgi:2-dehydropantoate 2-reductase